MTGPSTDQTSNSVLLVRGAPLTRVQLDGLLAHGVHVDHLTPQEINDALRDAPTEDVPARRDDILRRVIGAKVCVLDEGTGLKLGSFLLNTRQDSRGVTYTTLGSLKDIAHGIALRQEVLGVPQMHFEHLTKSQFFDVLRGHGSAVVTPPVARAVKQEPEVRPPRPLPYVAQPDLFSSRELDPRYDFGGRDRDRLLHGRVKPRALLEGDNADAMHDERVLTFLMRHLPTEDLHLMGSRAAHALWIRFIEANDERVTYRTQLDTILWNALARDGGRMTLAALPERFYPARDAILAQWDRTVAELAADLPNELASPHACGRAKPLGHGILRGWQVVPHEDPLAADAPANLYRPTLATLLVAQRYRTAGDVLLEAYRRWGGRPYQEKVTAGQLQIFVEASHPSSMEELDSWIRLLSTVPSGRFRHIVTNGIIGGWERVEPALANVMEVDGDHDNVYAGRIFEGQLALRIPCFTAGGLLHEGAVNEVTSTNRRNILRGVAIKANVRAARGAAAGRG